MTIAEAQTVLGMGSVEDSFYRYAPRPDDHELFDQQTSFLNDRLMGTAWLLGGNGCLAGEQEIEDPVSGLTSRVCDITGPFHVWSRNPKTGIAQIGLATKPFVKGTDRLYRVILSDGREFVCTMAHRLKTAIGWVKMSDLHIHSWLESAGDYPHNLRIEQIEFVRVDEFYDLTVFPHHNYLASGVWHHNSGTTETAMRKLARFVMDTPPPRPRTPYWIIGESYAQICAMWDEKLSPSGHGHIPESEIDWDNIAWNKPNRNWPFSVPLNKWPNGNSWTLVFKSYEQGRQKMQAESIGGFCFVEQFPWGIYQEVMRGSREYSFPGSKIAEFTPVDPEKSYALEVMIEEDTLPPGDKVYYLNTDCALAAGHVTQTWYDSFYGIVSDDMQDTRKRGLFSTFEGLIYKGFNQFVHLVGDDECFPGGEFPLNVQYRRALDWGSGIENAQVCLWGYFNSFGEWYIYDEYWSTDQETTVNQHLKLIYDRWGWPYNNPAFGMAYADPSSKDCIRIASRFSTVYPECDDFSMVGANNAVIEGIDHVKFLLQTQASTGKPRLFIHKANCPNLVREMRTYRWLVGAVAGRNPRQARPEPLKKDDHAVDTLRYLTFSEANTTGSVAQSFRRSSPAIKKSVRLDVQGTRGRMRR